MCREDRHFNCIPVSGSDGGGDSKHGDFRITRLHFVLGFLEARIGKLDFIESLHDHKGTLTVEVCKDLYRAEYESHIKDAWEAVIESTYEIDTDSACDRCSRNTTKRNPGLC